MSSKGASARGLADELVTSAPEFQLKLTPGGAIVLVHFVPQELFPRVVDALRRTPQPWLPIDTAPYRETVEVRAGSMTFLAMLIPDSSMTEDEETCDQWTAHIEGEHPPCWSGGACWSSNEGETPSLQPVAWRYPTQEGSA